ncbi:MAG: phage tail tape measure protein, partial [Candidatus Thermofonsia Clade 3 bacterium]
NASTVDVSELALGLANVGGSAKVAGLSFEETVQALALAAPYFSSAADAGTSFKTFLANLSPSTKEATETMIALGLATADGASKFFDAQGRFVGMEAAARLLADATRNLSNEQKLQALQTIFGADAIRFAAAMAEAGAAGYVAMGTAMAQAGGASAAAAQMQQGYTYAVEQLSGAWETLQIVIGSLVLPALTNLVGALATGIGGITAFVQSIAGADDPLVALGQAIGLTQQHAQAFAAGAQAVGQTAQAAFASLVATVGPLLQQLGQAVVTVVNQMIAWWQQHGAQVIAAVQPLWQEVVATAQAFGALLQQAVTSLLGAIASVWQAHGQTIITAAQTAWTIISG